MTHALVLLSAVVATGILGLTDCRAAPPSVAEIEPNQAVSFIDSQVQKQDHKIIGRTANVIVQDGVPQAAVIGLAGFMGIGNRDAAVPWDALRFDPTADPVQVTVDLTTDQLRVLAKAKPPAVKGQAEDTAETAPKLGLKLIDATLQDAKGKTLGEITDVLIDHASQPRAIVVTLGGTLDPNGREIAVAWSGISFGETKGKPTVSAALTPDQVKNATAYKAGKAAQAISPQTISSPQSDQAAVLTK
ncbi:MAG: PRC-barrel domain-containing protein [Pseudomonadota bacterium]|nr:PRC-barrel domain-containing protein [Pseudomonadota bacterium]